MVKRGRPSKFTEEIKNEILERMRDGESTRAICRLQHMPDWSNLHRYLAKEENEQFRTLYAQARETMIDAWAHDIIDRAKDDSRDVLETQITYTDSKGNVTEKHERRSDNTPVNRDRLIIDAMKWTMSKLLPQKYGDSQKVEHSGSINVQPVIELSTKKTE